MTFLFIYLFFTYKSCTALVHYYIINKPLIVCVHVEIFSSKLKQFQFHLLICLFFIFILFSRKNYLVSLQTKKEDNLRITSKMDKSPPTNKGNMCMFLWQLKNQLFWCTTTTKWKCLQSTTKALCEDMLFKDIKLYLKRNNTTSQQ